MLRFLLIAGLLGGAIPAATAQTTDRSDNVEDADSTPSTETSATIHDQVLVTASLDEVRADETSATATVIDRGQIADRQATEVAELLDTVPGLAVVQSGSPGKLTSLFTRGTNSGQTLVLWNGVKLNDPYFGGYDWAFLPTQGLDRIEIVRGPFSSLYGSEAIGGVIQMLSGNGDDVGARIEGGENGYQRASTAAGFEIGRAQIDLAAHLRRGDGEVENDFYNSEEVDASVRWGLDNDLELGVVARANESEIGIPFDFTGAASPQQTQKSTSLLLALPISWSRGPWKLEGQVSQYRADLEFRNPGAGFDRNDTEAETVEGRLVTHYRPTKTLTVSFGGDWEEQTVSNVSTFGTNLDDATASTWASFAQAAWEFGAVRLDAGLRRDDHDTFGTATTSKFGAVWHISPSTRVRASYGEGFRAPSLGELFFPFSGNADLRPEESESVEIGFDTRIETAMSAWTLSLIGFDTEQTDLIQFDFATFTNRNIGQAESKGVEGALGWQRSAWRVDLAATYLDTEDLTTGRELLRRPQESASLVVTWRPAERWSAHSTLRYVGDRLDIGDLRLPRYQTLEVGASFQATSRLEPFARIENLLDEEYEQASGFPAPGRRIFGGIALRVR